MNTTCSLRFWTQGWQSATQIIWTSWEHSVKKVWSTKIQRTNPGKECPLTVESPSLKSFWSQNNYINRLVEDSVSVQVKIKTDKAVKASADTPVSTPDPSLSLKAPTNHLTVRSPSLSVCETASRQKDFNTAELLQRFVFIHPCLSSRT